MEEGVRASEIVERIRAFVKKSQSRNWRAVAQCLCGSIALVLLSLVCFRMGTRLATAACLYLIIILLMSLWGSLLSSAVVSLVGVGCLAYFFAPPTFSLRVTDPFNVVSIIAFLSVSAIISRLVSKLRSSQERFRLVVQGVKDHAIFMLGLNGRVTSWNEGAQRIKHYEAEEIIGQHFSRFYLEEDVLAGKCERELETAAREGRLEDEGWRLRKDGSKFWAHVIITALRKPGGELIGFAMLTRDLTERRRLEEEKLRVARATEAIRLLDELFEQAPQAVALMDAGDRVVRVNRDFTRLFGYAPQEVIGHRLEELIVPEEAAEEPLARGQSAEMDSVRRHKDGTRLHVAIVRVPVAVPGGQVSVYGIYRDISERKRAEEMLQTFSQKLIETQEGERRRIARELHDEIGQVLTAIRLNLNTVQHSIDSSPIAHKLDDSIAIIDLAVQRVRDLSLNLRPPVLDDLGLVAALRWYVDREAQRADLNSELSAVELETRLSPELETACFRIAQEALTNVVRHAKARHVRVQLSQRGEELHLIIRDDGVGFDAAAMRGKVSDVRLGLLGMHERALIVGGRVEFVSAPGQGTEVYARFPLHQPAPGQQ